MSRITDLLGCRYPVIQGAMGVISNPELVAAVSEAGGFGLLATAFARDPEIVRDQAKATKQLTDKPFGANLFVIAAGGIGDSRGYRAAFALGAEGVQVGTRFIATKECIAHANYKSFILGTKETGTGLVDMGRFRIRALRTPLVERMFKGEEPTGQAFAGEAIEASWLRGDLEAGVLPAGEISGLISGVSSVKEIIEEMVGTKLP